MNAINSLLEPSPSASLNSYAADYYFEHGRNHYWLTSQQGGWMSVTESQCKRALKKQGVSPVVSEGAYLSPLENTLLEIQQSRGVHYAGTLAGYNAGLHEAEKKRVLVTESPQLITPRPGNWPNLKAVFSGLFQDERHNQLPYF